ncbi:Heavy metal transport/detoxification superfamily protein [Euphorbia peplus]|nr:Heavy metal transport/detoxification superfamily protein [Euphorbia peplus]
MTKDEDFKLLKIQTCVLKVNIHCDGCKQKVKKLLQRIEGVYQVNIDGDQQKVTVSGSVDAATLIKKLGRAGKIAQLWSQKPNNQLDQKQKHNFINNVNINNINKGQNKGILKGMEALKNQPKFPAFSSEEDDDDYFDEDDEDDDDYDDDEDEEDELRFLKPSQMGLLRQQMAANNAKKNIGVITGAPVTNNNNKMMMNNILNGNVEKKGIPNQNSLKMESDKAITGLKMNNNAQLGGSEIGRMMNLAGFHGNNNVPSSASSAALGNPNGHQGSSMMMNMNGSSHNHQPASAAAMMNMQNRNMMMQNQLNHQVQPQMMYQRSAMIPPNTGYYYNNYSTAPAPPPYYYSDHQQLPYGYGGDHSQSAAEIHMFSDDNTSSSCSIM